MNRILAALTLALIAPLAQAGSAGAGPGGNGAVTIGTLATAMTFELALDGAQLQPNEMALLGAAFDRLMPGKSGQLLLPEEQILAVFQNVSGSSGARVSDDGQVALSTVTLADGRGAVVLVNRGTRKITLIAR